MNGASSELIGLRRKHHSTEIGLSSNLISLLTKGCIVNTASPSCRQASDPRDIIFGLLALADDYDTLGICAKYSEIDQQIYTNVTKALIKHRHLIILGWCQQPKAIPSLPSWVPDFSAPIREPCCDNLYQSPFSASGQRPVSIPPANSHGPNILALRGTTVDTMLDVGTPWRPGLDSDFNYRAAGILFAEIKAFCARSWEIDPSKWPDTKIITYAIWKFPCAEQEARASEDSSFQRCPARILRTDKLSCFDAVCAEKARPWVL